MFKLSFHKISLISFVLFIIEVCPLFPELYRQNATVSYYAGDFHGKKTSNGEYFNMNDFTCASKTLPFDTVLKVTNLSNGLSVNVRVNDRGPFVEGRELDLSRAAAQKLDMIKTGTATVKIEIVKKGPDTKISQQTAEKAAQIMAKKYGNQVVKQGQTLPKSKTTVKQGQTSTEKKSYPQNTFWDIQIGAYSTRENANTVAQKLLKQGFSNVIFQKGESIVRVVIKGVPAKEVPEIENELKKYGYSDYVIRERKKD